MTSHQGKMDAITGHYKRVMGAPGASSWNFDLSAIYQGRPQASASNADTFLPSEALKAVRGNEHLQRPGPRWMQFLDEFSSGAVELERVNRAYMVLLAKKPGAVSRL